MLIRETRDSARRIVRLDASGRITFDHVRDAFLNGDLPAFPDDWGVLVDLREVQFDHMPFRHVVLTAAAAQARLSGRVPGRWALLVGEHGDRATARTFAALAAGWLRVGVFDEAPDAEAWLEPLDGTAQALAS